MTWEGPAHDRFGLYSGTLASLWTDRAYDHRLVGPCAREEAAAVLALPPESSYFLVASSCGEGEGSYGRDSTGVERPAAGDACP